MRTEYAKLIGQLMTIAKADPKEFLKMRSGFKRAEALAKVSVLVGEMRTRYPLMTKETADVLTTEKSEPFVRLMIGLSKHRHKVSEPSLVRWWIRMVATGQEHLIAYFSWKRLDEVFRGQTITGSDILRVCTDNEALFANYSSALLNDRNVDFKIRELLGGLSMASDVKKAWREWALANHPDKGGDPEQFLTVKLVYDEWLLSQAADNNNSTKQQNDK